MGGIILAAVYVAVASMSASLGEFAKSCFFIFKEAAAAANIVSCCSLSLVWGSTGGSRKGLEHHSEIGTRPHSL